MDSMGISPEGVIATARELMVEDIQEVLVKTSCFVLEMRKLQQVKKEEQPVQQKWPIPPQ